MLLVRMILKMVQVVNRNAYSLTFGIRTRYLVAALQGIDVILNMPAECILLAERPCAVFEYESFISKAEQAL